LTTTEIDTQSTNTPDAQRRSSRGLLIYLIVTFGLAWLIELGPVRTLGMGSGNVLVTLFMVAVMFCPAIGALVARKVEGSGFSDAGLRWGKGRYHLVGWLLPVALSALAAVLTVSFGLGQWDPQSEAMLGKLPPEQAEALQQMREQLGGMFPVISLLNAMIAGVLITSIATFGEEFGWRGYLQMRLERYGIARSMLLTGVIWGVWHIPVVIQGHNYPGYPIRGALLFIVFCVVFSFILGWLRNASGSVLAPTIAHAALNSPAAGLMVFTKQYNVLVGNVLGLVGIGLMALFVVWLFASGRLGPRQDGALAREADHAQEPLPASAPTQDDAESTQTPPRADSEQPPDESSESDTI